MSRLVKLVIPLREIAQNDSNKLLVMPVMVYGGTYSEDVENRRRRRYAVLSAMAMHGYRPMNAENIGYFEFPESIWNNASTKNTPQCSSGGCKDTTTAHPTFTIPYEYFRPDTAHYSSGPDLNNHPPVLLLWLDERQFEHEPLKKTAKLLTKVKCQINCYKLNMNVTLIGPAGSALLNKMVDEAYRLAIGTNAKAEIDCRQPDNNKDKIINVFKRSNFSIFSPTTTASAKLLLGQAEQNIRKCLKHGNKKCEHITGCKNIHNASNDFTSVFLIEEIFKEVGIQFFRTIASDKALARMLVGQEFKNWRIRANNPDDIVILVSEWDTFYGRALPETFGKAIEEERSTNGDASKREQYPCPHGICHYFYMRGLDGEIIPINGDAVASEAGSSKSDAKNGSSRERSAHDLERAVSVNRFDYLRRLGQQIKRDLSNMQGKVRAIGVLGSDVYDKLLVLQALRTYFPKALFFTTDADARYLHPAEFNWTRNLIVLSSYGLTSDQVNLPRYLISDYAVGRNIRLPSFRDSYQTSMFQATRLAILRSLSYQRADERYGSIVSDISLHNYLVDSVKPKVFEVGRSHFLPLAGEPGSLSKHRDQLNTKKSIPIVLFYFAIGMVLICLLTVQFDARHAGRAILGIFIVGGLPVLITYGIYLCDGTAGEPVMPFLSGANSLPTIAIVFLALTAALSLIFKAHLDLNKNACRLSEDFGLNSKIKNSSSIRWVKKLLFMCRIKRLCRIWSGRYFILKSLQYRSRLKANHVWVQYLRVGSHMLHSGKLRRYSLKPIYAMRPKSRVVVLALLHTAFAVTFIFVLDSPKPPIRGVVAGYAYLGSTILSLLFFFILLCVAVDQLRLCCALARMLACAGLEWPQSTLEKFAWQRGIDLYKSDEPATDSPGWKKESLTNWLSVNLLAGRAQAVEKLVYYPFIILLMLIVARSTLFDNWQFLPSIIIIIIISVLIIVAWTMLLRRAVKKARETVLESMRKSLSRSLALKDQGIEVEQVQLMINEVEDEQRGPFGPFANDPILKALLMPSGGYSALLLLEYFTKSI